MLLIWGLLSMNLNVTKAVFINLILLIQHGDYFLCVYTSCSYFINLIYVCTYHNANYISSGLRTFPCLAFSGFKMCHSGRLPFNEYQANTAVCIIWPPQHPGYSHSMASSWTHGALLSEDFVHLAICLL